MSSSLSDYYRPWSEDKCALFGRIFEQVEEAFPVDAFWIREVIFNRFARTLTEEQVDEMLDIIDPSGIYRNV